MGPKPLDEKTIFQVACGIESMGARGDYLNQACGDDQAVMDRVVTLLRMREEDPGFLESPPTGLVATVDWTPIAERPGTMVGRYKLLQEIGEGGMGVVYMAEQREPVHRKVALKIIKPGMDTKDVVTRFGAERQALAMMDHANIAKVLDAGSTESGRPYFVMELVHGIRLTKYCDQNQLTTGARLELFILICQAVQHAHQKGIIHRDIKPSNILVTLADGVPVPKIIDFGVAKATNRQLTDKTMFTGYGQMIGTPLYMSPEQAEMSAMDVDTRSDIYSLGVVLYELLTGSTPFDKERLREADLDEVRRLIREQEPARPSTRISTLGQAASTVSTQRNTDPVRLSHSLRGELDWIVMKALEKDRTRRYETASDFAKDVQRYLDDEPVEACPPSMAYWLRKFVRRNKASVFTVAAVALALVLGLIGTTWQAVRATKAEAQERNQAEIADRQRQAAEANYVRAREAVKQMLTRVADEELAAIPEMAEVRLQLMQDARLFYDELIKLNPEDPQAYFERAGVRVALAEPREEVAADYEKSIELAPSNARFEQGFSGFILYKVHDAPGALRHAQRAVELAPNDAGYLGWEARIHSSLGEYDKALELHEKAVAAAPTLAGVYASRSIDLCAKGNLEDALADARKAIELEPALHCGWDALSNVLVAMKDYDEALVAMDRAIEIAGPKRGTKYLYSRRHEIHRQLGNTPLALQDINRAIELGPEAAYLYSNRAAIYKDQGRPEEALADWTATIQLVPTQWHILKRRGWLYFELGRYDEALVDIAKAVELQPGDLTNLTWIPPNRAAKCPDERFRAGLLALADKSIELSHKAGRAYATRGWILAEFGQEEKALADLKRAFDGIPKEDEPGRLGWSDTCYELSNLCGQLAHRQEVISYLTKMAGIHPEKTLFSYWAALAQLGAGQFDSYRDTCRATLQQFQDTATPADGFWVAWTCLLGPKAVDDYAPVVRLAEQAVEADPDSEVYLNALGAIRYRANRLEEAVERLTKANNLIEDADTESTSSPAYTWYFLAMAHHKLGDNAEAKRWLDKATEWTKKVLAEHEEGTSTLSWNRRLTLKLLRDEAEEMIGKDEG